MKTIYISYAWKDVNEALAGSREELVDQLCLAFEANNLTVRRDKNRLKQGDSISEFTQEIGRGDCVLVVLSRKYLLDSEFCMGEMAELCHRKDFRDIVYPIVLDDANQLFSSPEARVALRQHWEQKLDNLKHSGNATNRSAAIPNTDIKNRENIVDYIQPFLEHIADQLRFSPEELVRSNFEALIVDIKRRLFSEQPTTISDFFPLPDELDFSNALRPSSIKTIWGQLLRHKSIDIYGSIGFGKGRMMEDLKFALKELALCAKIDVSKYTRHYRGLLQQTASALQVQYNGSSFADLVQNVVLDQQMPVVLLLYGFEALLDKTVTLDPLYDQAFMEQLNSLKENKNVYILVSTLLPCTLPSVAGFSSKFMTTPYPVHEISEHEVEKEARRNIPELHKPFLSTISEHCVTHKKPYLFLALLLQYAKGKALDKSTLRQIIRTVNREIP